MSRYHGYAALFAASHCKPTSSPFFEGKALGTRLIASSSTVIFARGGGGVGLLYEKGGDARPLA